MWLSVMEGIRQLYKITQRIGNCKMSEPPTVGCDGRLAIVQKHRSTGVMYMHLTGATYGAPHGQSQTLMCFKLHMLANWQSGQNLSQMCLRLVISRLVLRVAHPPVMVSRCLHMFKFEM